MPFGTAKLQPIGATLIREQCISCPLYIVQSILLILVVDLKLYTVARNVQVRVCSPANASHLGAPCAFDAHDS